MFPFNKHNVYTEINEMVYVNVAISCLALAAAFPGCRILPAPIPAHAREQGKEVLV